MIEKIVIQKHQIQMFAIQPTLHRRQNSCTCKQHIKNDLFNRTNKQKNI